MAGCCCQHSHKEPIQYIIQQLDPREKPNHIISDSVDRIGWWSFLAFIIFGVRDGPNPSGTEKNDCQWRRWIPIMVFDGFVSTTRSFATRHQHGMENNKKWCEMTRIFQSCLRFDSHTTFFWQSTANCHVSGKALSKTLSGTTQKPTVAPPSLKAKCFAQATAVLNFSLVYISVPRLRIWVIQPMNDARCARAWYVLANFSLQFLEPWQCTASELWYWYGRGRINTETTPSCQQTVYLNFLLIFVPKFRPKPSATTSHTKSHRWYKQMVAGQMGFELGSKECSICFSQRPRLFAGLRKDRTQSLQVREFGMKSLTARKKIITDMGF